MPATRTLRFDQALTPDGWRRDVAITFAGDGTISSVADGAVGGERISGIALPGVANLHCHAFQRAMAGLAERAGEGEDSFWSWRELMYRFLDRIAPDDAEAIAGLTYTEMLESGFTRVAEFHYLHHQPDGAPYANIAEMAERHFAAADTAGIGMTMLPVFYAHGGFGGAEPTPGQRRFICDLDRFGRIVEACSAGAARHAGARVGIAPHSLRAVTLDELRALDRLLPGAPRHIHVSEQMKEVDDCRARHGVTPIALLADTVNLDARWCLIHATHATDAEIGLMSRSQAVAGLCPVTEANLGDGAFRARTFMDRGGRFGVGSDSNVLIGLADELRQLEYSQRLAHRRRNVLADRGGSTARRLFDAALVGGAQACGMDACGLRAGAAADIVVLDAAMPELTARNGDAALDSFVFASRRNPVRDVFTRGRHVVRDGRHIARPAAEQAFAAALRRLLD
jgi:formimidoylglutamate deiminase